jgi:hypothetical protein
VDLNSLPIHIVSENCSATPSTLGSVIQSNMSHYSGFSSASRMEIERLNQEAALKDQKLAAMEAMLAANGLLEQNQTKTHAQTQVRTQVQTKVQVHLTPNQYREHLKPSQGRGIRHGSLVELPKTAARWPPTISSKY